MCAWFYRLNSENERFMGNFYQTFSFNSRFADIEHLAGVSMIPILDDGDVYIDDITFF